MIELKNRKPISVTKIIVQPTEVVKDIDSISVAKDSVFIEDFYPKKEDYFLKYTNRFSLKTEKGLSNFKFNPINLTEVVTKKEDGLYQVDFKGPDFLEVNSINIQTTPVVEPIKDNWGTLIGIEYGKNLEFDKSLFELNVYQRYKKFYIGGSVNTREEVKAGIKIEF